MHTLSKSIITGALIGTTMAIGLYFAAAAPGVTGMPEGGLAANLLGRIIDPTDMSRVQDANNLGDIPSASWQRNVSGGCTGRTWAAGVDASNNIVCRNW